MAIDPQFIREKGPFVGVTCLPWRERGQMGSGGVRAALAVNVDFSRGSIRPRRGSSKFAGLTSRVMGLHDYRKRDGQSLVIAIILNETTMANTAYPWTLEFHVYDTNGTKLNPETRLDQYPFAETPDPDNWYTMAQFNNTLFIASHGGQVLQYDYEVDADKPEVSTGDVLETIAATVKIYTTFPQGSMLVEHDGLLVVAGFDGQRHVLNQEVEKEQWNIDPEKIDSSKIAVRFHPNELIISEDAVPRTFAFDRLVPFSKDAAIRGLASTSAGLLVLTDSSVYSLQIKPASQDAVQGPLQQVRLLVAGIGCVGHRTVVQGRGLTAWLGYDGVYLYDGETVRSISDDISELWGAGRWQEGPIFALGETAAKLGYPFVLQKGRMDRACGAFHAAASTFVWAVPLGGYEDYNRLIISYHLLTESWSLSAPIPTATATGVTALRPTNFATIYDRGKQRLLYSDYNKGIYGYSEAEYDHNPDGGGSDTDILWMYQGPMHDLGAGITASPKALQIRQQANASTDTSSWYLEAERNFDMDNDELGDTGTLHSSPQKAPPISAASVGHHWNEGAWGSTRWHRAAPWRARYPVAPINGNSFRVGFAAEHGGKAISEIFDYAIEFQGKKDVT